MWVMMMVVMVGRMLVQGGMMMMMIVIVVMIMMSGGGRGRGGRRPVVLRRQRRGSAGAATARAADEQLALLLALAAARVAEAFGEGVMIDLELRDFFVLVSRDGDELRLLEDVSAEGAPGQLEHVVGAHDVETRLVFVHRIQNRLLWRRFLDGGVDVGDGLEAEEGEMGEGEKRKIFIRICQIKNAGLERNSCEQYKLEQNKVTK